MKTINIVLLLCILNAFAMFFAQGRETPIRVNLANDPNSAKDLNSAKEHGRAKSGYLKAALPDSQQSTTIPTPNLAFFQKSVAPILNKSCLDCHGPKKAQGRLRMDKLNPDLLAGPDVEKWREIFNAISNSEMPPENEPGYALAAADRGTVGNWLAEELNKASIIRRNTKDHSSFRRLTKYEYDYALQDLLGLPYSLASKLPPESTTEDGFKNSSELLQMTSMQFETYREIAVKALKRATITGERPKPVTYIIPMGEEMDKAVSAKETKVFDKADKNYARNRNSPHFFNRETGKGIRLPTVKSMPQAAAVVGQSAPASPVVVVLSPSSELKLDLDRFLPDEGIMRVRIRVGRSTMKPDEYASLRLMLSAHTSNDANFSQVISPRDLPVTASLDNPEWIHFDIPLGDIQRNPFRKLATTFPRRDEFLHIHNVSNAGRGEDPLGLHIDAIEISAPFYEQWPPKTHTEIFFQSANKTNEELYAREILNRFLGKVWRRPVTSAEVGQFMALFAKYRPEFASLEETMIEVLATALASPEFLYLSQRVTAEQKQSAGKISELELASRLSVFLWSSIPDEELLKLAEQGKLRRPEILEAQVKRMLADPRSKRFTQNFVEQWLGLDGLSSVTHIPAGPLRESLREEPIAYFDEVLRNNLSIIDFIHSDYAVVNETLANHYGIPKVYGPHFRKVPIGSQAHRGGILTVGAMLAMNSDGKDSHPLKRGVWMLKRILHDPPPPPPPNVPEVDLTNPEILKMTLKERIVDHRNKPACISCHAKIDPWGIAFENYDALGVFRTSIKNKPVDATSELFNHQTLAGIDGLKGYLLLDRQDQFARSMVHKLVAYALGRPLVFGDRAEIDRLTGQARRQDDRLGDLIQLIVRSDIFNSP